MERYRVSRAIARGGMCEILEAFREGEGGFERKVAIKRLKPELAEDESVRRAFFDEARILSKIAHAHVVQIFDFGELEGRPIQVLEFVDGADLGALRSRAAHRGEAMSPEVALRVAADAAVGLDFAHRVTGADGASLSVVHRDVTPHNLLISADGQVKVIDFGVAFAEHRLDRTLVGETKGTLPFMAPEQARGEPVDARADVFGLGCVLHWCLTGKSPLEVQAARLAVYANEPPPLSSDLPKPVQRVVRRATQPRPAARYPSAQAFAEDCWQAIEQLEVREGPASVQRWARRFAGAPEAVEARPHAVGDLFDIALLEEAKDTGRDEAPLRRFRTVAAAADTTPTQLPLGQTVPVDVALEDPQTKLTTDRAAVPNIDVEDATAIIESIPPPDADTERRGPPGVGDLVYGYRLVERFGPGFFRANHEVRPGTYWVEVDEQPCRDEVLARRRTRARALAGVSAPGLPEVLECGRTPAGFGFWISKAEGDRPLGREPMQAGLPDDEVLERMVALASALRAGHGAGVVHGAVRVSRVVQDPVTAEVTLLGFGRGDDPPPDPDETVSASFEDLTDLAPERRAGGPASIASDLYGLGAIAHLWLTGQPPVAGATLALPSRGGLGALVSRLLSEAPMDRPESASAVLARLERLAAAVESPTVSDMDGLARPRPGSVEVTPVADPNPAPARPAPPNPAPTPAAPPARGWMGPALGGLGFVLVLAVGGFLVGSFGPSPEPIEIEPAPTVSLAEVQRSVEQGMRLLDLTPEDLDQAPTAAEDYRRCRAALDSGRTNDARTACAALVEGLGTVPVSARMLHRTRDQVQGSLSESAGRRPAAQHAELEARLRAIEVSMQVELPERERRKVLRRLQQLRVDAQR